MAQPERMTEERLKSLALLTDCNMSLVERAEREELLAEVEALQKEKADRLCPSCRVDRCERCAATHECQPEDIAKLENVTQ